MGLSPDFLLRGAFYSMEQAWHLLQDAVFLFQRGSYGSSLVLSIYCLEEIGRAEIYLHQRGRALTCGEVTVKELQEAHTKHKLKLGQGHITVTVCLPVSFAEPPPPDSPEMSELHARFEQVRRLSEAEAPRRAHEARMKALYVDLNESRTRWNRPCEVTKDEADEWLGTACVAYDQGRARLMRPRDPELAGAIRGSANLPELPEPPWDLWDWSEPGGMQKDANRT